MPKISIVISSCNRPEGLSQALESIYRQTQTPYEIIVVDDASNTPISVSIFAKCPKSIKTQLLRNKKSKKSSGARNIGILASTGEYISFLDDDDQFYPEKLEIIYPFILKNNFPDIIYHAAHIIMVNENIEYITSPKNYTQDIFFNKMLISNCVGGTPMVVAKRESLINAGLFNEKLPAIEDYELWLRMAKMNFSFTLLDEPLTQCFYFTKTMSVSKNFEKNLEARLMIEYIYKQDIEQLTPDEKKNRLESISFDSLQRSLLIYDYVGSLKQSLQIFLKNSSIKNFFIFIITLFGSYVTFKVRSWTK